MALIVHPSKRCAGSVTFKGGPKRFKFLYDLFKDNNLIDQAKASSFGQFFSGLDYKFCGQLVHALMLRKVRSSSADEIQFLLGDNVCKFGQREFGLVSGLRFGPDYSDEEWNKYTSSRRLIIKHFENSQKIHISTLEAALKVCTDVDDIWKLGLVYFVEGVLLGMDKSYVVPTKFICLADYPEKFLSYPWGKRAWSTTFKSLKKDMLHFCEWPKDNNMVDDQAHKGAIVTPSVFWPFLLKTLDNQAWPPILTEIPIGKHETYTTPWFSSSTIYSVWNIKNIHWVTITVSLPDWCIRVYDSSVGVGNEIEIIKNLNLIANLLPILLGMFSDFHQLPHLTNALDVVRIPHTAIPQSDSDGDCGVYALKHLEHLITNQPLTDVDDSTIPYFRARMAIDIFHQSLDP